MKNYYFHSRLTMCFLCLCCFTACQKEESVILERNSTEVYRVTVCDIYTVRSNSLKVKAETKDSGNSEMGVCWTDSNEIPTILKQKITQKPVNNVISVEIKSLKPQTTYMVRAYAIFKNEPVYSEVFTIKTLPLSESPFKIEL